MTENYRKKVLLLILISSIIRLITAGMLELGNDEVYYWTYAEKLQWNYFDHPPMVAIWIRLFTGNLAFDNSEIFVRLGSIFSCAVSTYVIFKTVQNIHSQKAGWYAALLFNASIYASIVAGLFILPDSPQILFWTICLWLISRIHAAPRNWMNWILFGIAAGLCFLSKVHAAFIWIGLGSYIIFKRGEWLRLPQLYVAVILTAIIISPVILWNIDNDFITYRFHSERVTVNRFAINITGFVRELSGQFFYNNPLIVIAGIAALLKRKDLRPVLSPLSIYNFIALPMIIILIVVSLFRSTFPHWSGPAWVTLIPLTAIHLAERKTSAIAVWALRLTCFVLTIGVLVVSFYPGTIGKKDELRWGTHDFTLDMYGWRDAGIQVDNFRQGEIKNGVISERSPLLTDKWFPAAHEDYYFCKPFRIQMIGLGSMLNLHHYMWLNEWRKKEVDMSNALCVVPSNLYINVKDTYGAYYQTIDSVYSFETKRSGKTSRKFYIYRLSGWKGEIPGAKAH